MTSIVSIVQDNDPRQCVAKAIDLLGGIQNFVHADESILVKPNLVVPLKTETGVVTNPAVIQSLVERCYHAGAKKVYVGDSPFFPFKARYCFKATGMKDAVIEAGGEVLYFDEGPYTELSAKEAVILPKIRIPQKIETIDGIITVPRLKTHNQTVVSLSLKNQHGLVPPEDKMLYHKDDLHQKLIDINHIIKPKLRLALIDGTFALEGQGPTFGKPLALNLCLASRDFVAVDSVATTLMGFSPRDITHLRLAALQGLGEIDLSKIQMVGTPLKNVSRQFLCPSAEIIGIAPNVHVYAGGACRPGCFAWARVALDSLLKRDEIDKYGDLTFIIGKNPTVPPNLTGQVFVVGDCAAEYKDKGKFFPGCPPFEIWELRNFLKEKS
ncbi:MAG: DUF362 domain-containing protein [Candidatus Helarchaeota archaeon]|nr:DUF362 domain-containing protein [Candidatus Helarchaeota archaeon]